MKGIGVGRLNPSYVPTFYVPELACRRQDWKNPLRMIKRTKET
jgi:hypothetical protein